MFPSFLMSNPFSYSWQINGRSMSDQLFGPPFQFNNELIINISYLQLPGLAMGEPASKASIQSLKIIKSREDEKSEEECSICLQKLFDKENKDAVVKETPCGHKYHGKCIDKWLDIHGSCPLCRYNMTQENGEEEVSDDEMDFWDEDDSEELEIGLF